MSFRLRSDVWRTASRLYSHGKGDMSPGYAKLSGQKSSSTYSTIVDVLAFLVATTTQTDQHRQTHNGFHSRRTDPLANQYQRQIYKIEEYDAQCTAACSSGSKDPSPYTDLYVGFYTKELLEDNEGQCYMKPLPRSSKIYSCIPQKGTGTFQPLTAPTET